MLTSKGVCILTSTCPVRISEAFGLACSAICVRRIHTLQMTTANSLASSLSAHVAEQKAGQTEQAV